MLTYISSWFFSPIEDEVFVTEEQKQNRYKVLKEIKDFDKSNLLAVPETIENFIQQKKQSKIFTFKKKRKRKRKKSNN